jgi:hypothetical protein
MRRLLLALSLWSLNLSALAVCQYPLTTPEIPAGATATEEQMLAAQKSVKEYVSQMEAYMACLDQESAALGDTITEAQKHVHAQKHNAAIDAMEGIADKYNAEVRAYQEAKQQ